MSVEAGPSSGIGPTPDEKRSEIEHRIMALAQTHPTGFSNEDLATNISDIPTDKRAAGINDLLRKGLLELLMQGKTLMYKLKAAPAKGMKGGGREEKVVYGIIEDAGNKGIWIKDIRIKSNLLANQLNKVLKTLESRKMIKSLTTNSANRKKVYLLSGLEPDVSLTGGAWYGKDDFEVEFVDILNQQVKKYLLHKRQSAMKSEDLDPVSIQNVSRASIGDVLKYIETLGISNVKLSEKDIESLLNTIVYDGKAERHVTADGTVLYRYVEPLLEASGLTQTPCGVCPIQQHCSLSGQITPLKCTYLTSWLNEHMGL